MQKRVQNFSKIFSIIVTKTVIFCGHSLKKIFPLQKNLFQRCIAIMIFTTKALFSTHVVGLIFQDFTIFPSGDQTLVGERGITLSGGQKARVSLARMAYRSDTDVVVMDDPLSAVDPSVADHLFEKCICGLLKKKVRISITSLLF